MKESAGIGLLACTLIIALVVGWWLIGGFILMVAWNALLPYLVGAPTLSYGQAVAGAILLMLIGGAFKSTVSYVNK